MFGFEKNFMLSDLAIPISCKIPGNNVNVFVDFCFQIHGVLMSNVRKIIIDNYHYYHYN